MPVQDATGSAEAGVKEANRTFATGTPNPSLSDIFIGEMTERPKVYDWKSYVPGRVPWVQIPLSP